MKTLLLSALLMLSAHLGFAQTVSESSPVKDAPTNQANQRNQPQSAQTSKNPTSAETKPDTKTPVSNPSAPPVSSNQTPAPSAPTNVPQTKGKTTYVVKGMDCEACEASVKAKVCSLPGVEACDIRITNVEKKLGEVVITPREGAKVKDSDVKKAVKSAGSGFKVKEVHH